MIKAITTEKGPHKSSKEIWYHLEFVIDLEISLAVLHDPSVHYIYRT